MRVELKKGHDVVELEIRDEQLITIMEPQQLPEDTDQIDIVKEAMNHPIGTKHLKDIVHEGEKVVIVTSDITRPVPSALVLPPVLEELSLAGIKDEDILICFGRGSHRNQTEEEMIHLVGEDIYRRYTCVDSNSEDVVRVGVTKQGTPVDIDRRVVEADRRICIGNVEFHYFAGFSGGAKAIMPGMSTHEAIQYNHRLMVDEKACAGNLDTNPVRQDLEEACAMVGVDYIVNVVLNTKKQVIYASAGDVTRAHRDACAYLSQIYRSPITQKADIVLVSQGGAPKDINLYQMQKALDNAKYAVNDGGVIILVGSCQDGFGQKTFGEWMEKYTTSDEMIEALQKQFVLGGHKAASIALVQKKADIMLVSDMDSKVLERTILKPYDTVEHAYLDALKKCGEDASVIVMPYGGSTLPYVTESSCNK